MDQKSFETEFLVAICRPTEDMAIKNTVSRDLRLFSIAAYPVRKWTGPIDKVDEVQFSLNGL